MSRVSSTWGRMRNTPGLFKDLVTVAVMLGLGLATTTVLVGNYDVKPPWSDRFVFSADFHSAPAIQLASRQEVRIAGVSVGRVVDAAPVDDGARLTFEVDPEQTVYRNASLVVRSKTPVNIMYVTLDPGTPAAGELPEGDTLPITQTDQITQPFEVFDNLDARTRTALSDLLTEGDVALAGAPERLPAGLEATLSATSSFEPVIDLLAERREHLRRLVTSLAQVATAVGQDDERLGDLMGSLQTTLAVVADHDQQLNASLAELPGLTTTLRDSLRATTALTSELDPALEQIVAASGRLPETVERLTSTVRNGRGLIARARPVIAEARPVIADLRPLTADARSALIDLRPVTAALPNATARLTPWLTNLGAFVYNTSSSFSLGDANGGMGRANLVVEALEPTGASPEEVLR